jgi:hypothetical protein
VTFRPSSSSRTHGTGAPGQTQTGAAFSAELVELQRLQSRDPLAAERLKARIVQDSKARSRRRRAVWARVGLIQFPRQQEAKGLPMRPPVRPRGRRERRAARSSAASGDSGVDSEGEPPGDSVVGRPVPHRRPEGGAA